MFKFFFLVLVTGIAYATASLDFISPVIRIRNQILETKTAGQEPNWTYVPSIIKSIIPCIPSNESENFFSIDSDNLSPLLAEKVKRFHLLQAADFLLNVDWTTTPGQRPTSAMESSANDSTYFYATPTFQAIHERVWSNEGIQFLVAILYNNGFPNIYAKIKDFYIDIKREDLADGLPSGPPPFPKSSQSPPKHSRSKRSIIVKHNIPVITPRYDIIEKATRAEKCNPLGLLNQLNKSHIDEVIKIFLYAVQEFLGSLHILGFFLYDPTIMDLVEVVSAPEVLPQVQQGLLKEESIHQLNELLWQVSGLDLHNFELFKYTFDLLRWLIWNHPFPAGQAPA